MSSKLGLRLVSETKAILTRPGRGEGTGVTLFEELPATVLIVRLEVEVEVEASCLMGELGPIRESTTGNRTRPWKRPNITVRTNTLKNVIKTWE